MVNFLAYFQIRKAMHHPQISKFSTRKRDRKNKNLLLFPRNLLEYFRLLFLKRFFGEILFHRAFFTLLLYVLPTRIRFKYNS